MTNYNKTKAAMYMKLNSHIVTVAIGFCMITAVTSLAQQPLEPTPATIPILVQSRQATTAASAVTPVPRESTRQAHVVDVERDPLADTQDPAAPAQLNNWTSRNGLIQAYSANLRANASARSERPLLVRSTDADAKTLGAMEEDLNIMARILEKAAPQTTDETPDEAMGIKLVMMSGAGGAQTMQIEGYGAVFQLRVNIPLRGTVEPPEEATAKPPADSPWEQTKQELRSRYSPPASSTPNRLKSRANTYNPKLVERLKDALLTALRNASNMSHLKSDETVTIVVRGTGQPIATPTDASVVSDNIAGNYLYYSKSEAGITNARLIQADKGDGAILTIRAKKSDIDDFAKDKLSLDQFRKKASILLY